MSYRRKIRGTEISRKRDPPFCGIAYKGSKSLIGIRRCPGIRAFQPGYRHSSKIIRSHLQRIGYHKIQIHPLKPFFTFSGKVRGSYPVHGSLLVPENAVSKEYIGFFRYRNIVRLQNTVGIIDRFVQRSHPGAAIGTSDSVSYHKLMHYLPVMREFRFASRHLAHRP